MVRHLVFLLLIFLISCSKHEDGGSLVIELISPPDQSPLEQAAVITLSLWNGNDLILTSDFPAEMKAGSIENIPGGIPLRAIVEAKDSKGVVIARGRTEDFILQKGAKIEKRVFFSKPGTFSKTKRDMDFRENYAYSHYSPSSVIFTGGTNINGEVLRTTEIYRHEELSFSRFSDLIEARANHLQILLDDKKIAIISGINNAGMVDGIELLDNETEEFKSVTRITIPRIYATATALSTSDILICGGYSNGSAMNSCELFSTKTNSIQLLSSKMAHFRYNHSAIMLESGDVLFSGGTNLNSIELFNPATGAYILPVSFTSSRSRHYMSFINPDMLIFACGEKEAQFELLQLSSSQVFTRSDSSLLPGGCSALLMEGGKIFIAGGLESGMPTDLAMIIDIETDKVIWSGKMLNRRINPSLSMMEDGAILVVGGSTSQPFAELFNPPW